MENQEVADARNEATTEREHVTTDAATRVNVRTKAGQVNNDEAPLGDDSNVEKALDKAENQLEAAVESFQHDMKIIESVQNVKTGLDIRKVFPDLKPALEAHYVSLEEDKEDNKDGFFMKIFKAIRDAIKWVWDKIVAVFKKIGEWLGLVKKSAEKKVEEAKDPEKVVVAKVNAEVQKEEVKKEQADKMPTDEEIQQLEKAAAESNVKTQEEFVQQLAKVGNVSPDVVKEKLKPTTEAIKAATGVEPIDPKATPKEQVKQIKAVKNIAKKAQEAPKVKEQEPLTKVVSKENLQNLSDDVKKAVRDPKQLKGKIKIEVSKEAGEYLAKMGITELEKRGIESAVKLNLLHISQLVKDNLYKVADLDVGFLVNAFSNKSEFGTKELSVLLSLASGFTALNTPTAKKVQISPTNYLEIPTETDIKQSDVDVNDLSKTLYKLSIKDGVVNNSDKPLTVVTGITGEVFGDFVAMVNDTIKEANALIDKLSKDTDKIKLSFSKAVDYLEKDVKESKDTHVHKQTVKAVQMGATNAINNAAVASKAIAELIKTYNRLINYVLSEEHFIITAE